MYVSPRETFAELFARKAEITRELQMRITEELRARELSEREKQRQKREDATWEFVAAVLATEAQIQAFTAKLDRYDTATVEAIMENEEARAEVQHYLNDMLARAEVLPDGRRVFETRDGTKVFDEHGNEVGREEIAPEDIADSRPKWEAYQEANERKEALKREREELQEHQEKIDEAREAAADPNVTEDKLKSLEAELEASAPEAVRRRVEEPKPEDSAVPVLGTVQPTPLSAPIYSP